MKKSFFLVLILVTLFIFKDNYAQNKHDGIAPVPITASITAKGTVLSPISVTSTRDLDFGNDILPGISRTIDKNSISAGQFTIMGEAGKEVNMTISLPVALYNGTNSLPISFTQTDGGYKVTGGTMVDFDPLNPVNANIGSDGALEIYLGGSVSPAYRQTGGDYTGTIIIEFNYTGN